MMLPARCCSLRRNFASFLLCLTVSYGLIALVGVVFPGSLPRSLAQSTDSAPSFQDSPTELLTALDPWVELKWDDRELKADFGRTANDYQEMIDAFRTAYEIRSQRSARGGNTWMHGLANEKIEFEISFGVFMPHGRMQRGPIPSLQFWCSQIDPVPDELNIRIEPSGVFDYEWTRHRDNFDFRLRRSDDGRVEVTLVQEDQALYLAEDSMWTLCTRHANVFESTVAPLLRTSGIRPPLTPESPEVVEAVLRRLEPVDPDRLGRFMEQVKKLNDEDFHIREEATRELADRFAMWRDLIVRHASDRSLPLECRTRLKKLLELSDEGVADQARGLVDELDLLNDETFLKRLLYKLSQDGDRRAEAMPLVVRRIEEMRGQPLSSQDVAGIIASEEELVAKEDSDGLVRDVAQRLAELEGPLNTITTEVQRLVPLKIRSGRLVFDREFWQDFFQGQSVEELVGKVRAVVEQNHLPPSWVQPGGPYLLDTMGFPQLLFESLSDVVMSQEEAAPTNPGNTVNYLQRIAAQSRNRKLDSGRLSARLLEHPEPLSSQRTVMVQMGKVNQLSSRKPPPVPESQFLLVWLQEPQAPARELRVFDGLDGRVSVTLTSPADAQMIHLAQSSGSGQLSLTVWSSGKTLRRSAPNVEDLVKTVGLEDWRLLESALAQYGISIGNSLQK